MRKDFKESTETKNEVDAIKTEKFRKDDSSVGPDGNSQETASSSTLKPLQLMWEIVGPNVAKLSSESRDLSCA